VRTERLRREFDLELRWTVFPLHPETPEAGCELTDLLGMTPQQLAPLQARLREVAQAEGLALAKGSRTYNSRRAQELGKWAASLGQAEPWHQAVYRAFFVEGRNIALAQELAALAASVGLPADQALQVLAEGRYAAKVDEDWQRCAALGIRAVPTHVCGEKRVVGFAGYPEFVRLIGRD
jgi:predicted DsbA family dithiol-disulfide isomerase